MQVILKLSIPSLISHLIPILGNMGSNDIPPSHVPSHVVPTYNLLLQIGGGLWTISYILYVRESFVSKSYGMPLFACALNFGWEIIFALIIAESPLERLVFASWVIIDCGIVVGIIKHAKYEWVHSPVVARNIGWLFGILVLGATMAHGTFAKWWLDNEIGRKEGKIFRGRLGPDVDELAWWGCVVCQSYSSMDGLRQLVVRHHSGGVSWSIWLVIYQFL